MEFCDKPTDKSLYPSDYKTIIKKTFTTLTPLGVAEVLSLVLGEHAPLYGV